MAHSGQGTLACVECTRRVICADVVRRDRRRGAAWSHQVTSRRGRQAFGWRRKRVPPQSDAVSGATPMAWPTGIRSVTSKYIDAWDITAKSRQIFHKGTSPKVDKNQKNTAKPDTASPPHSAGAAASGKFESKRLCADKRVST